MYQNFSLLGIEAQLKDRKIILEFSKVLDYNRKDETEIKVYERANKIKSDFDYCFDDRFLIITLAESPVPNTDYILSVKNVFSVYEEKLSSNINTRINFKSDVISKVEIISPVQFQEVNNLVIELKETADNEADLTDSFFIEISKDNHFDNICNSFITKDLRTPIYIKESGQYFIHARAQTSENAFGAWSDTVTFIKTGIKEKPDDQITDSSVETEFKDNEPSVDFDDAFDIIEMPEQGVTPEEGLLIEFNHKLNEMSVDSIIIVREEVR